MPRKITFEGKSYTFPDDATDDEIAGMLDSASAPAPAAPASTGGIGDLVSRALSRAEGAAGGLVGRAAEAVGLGPKAPSTYQQSSDLDAQMRGQPAAPVTSRTDEANAVTANRGALGSVWSVAHQGARGLAEGAGTMVGLPVDLTTMALNAVPQVRALREAMGLTPNISKPFLGSDFNKGAVDATADAQIGLANRFLPEAMQIPEQVPGGANLIERGANRVGQEIGAAMVPAGAAVGKAAQVGMEGARAIQNPIARHFVEQAAAGPNQFIAREVGAAGAAGLGASGINELTRAAGVDEHGAGHAAGDLAGALGGLSLYSVGSHAISKAGDIAGAITGSDKFANQVVRDAVVDRLAGAAGAPTVAVGKRDVYDTSNIVDAIKRGRETSIGDTVQGYRETLSDVTQNPGIAQAEYGRRTAGSPTIAQRGTQNESAVNSAIDALAPEGQPGALRDRLADRRSTLQQGAATDATEAQARFEEAASRLQAQMHPDARGQDIRGALEDAKAAAREAERGHWSGVSDGEADIRPLVDSFGNVRSGLTQTARDLFDPSHLTGIPRRFLPAEAEEGAEAAGRAAGGPEPTPAPTAPAPAPTAPAPAQSAADRIMAAAEAMPRKEVGMGRDIWDLRAQLGMPEEEFRQGLAELQQTRRGTLSQFSDPKSLQGRQGVDLGAGERQIFVPGDEANHPSLASWPDGRPAAPRGGGDMRDQMGFPGAGEASPRAQAQEAQAQQQAQRQPEPPPPGEPSPPAAPENGPVPVSLRETADLRSALSAEHRDALSTANPARARVIEQYISALDDYARANHPNVEAYDAARDYSRQLNDRFTRPQSDVAQVLDRNQGMYRQSDASVPGRFTRPDTASQDGFEALMREAGTDPRARNAVADQIREAASSAQTPEAVGRFVDDHSRVLANFPELRAQLTERANAQHVAGNAARRQEDLTASLGTENSRGTSSVGKYLHHGTEQTSRAIQGVFTAAKPAEAARELLEFAGRDREAVAGMRRAIWDEAERVGRRKGETTASTDGVQPWMPGKLKAFVDKPNVRAVLQEAYRDEPEHLENLDKLAEVLQHTNVGARGKAPNSSGTAQGVLGALSNAVSMEGVQSGIMSVKRGQIGVPYLVTSIAARAARNAVKSAQRSSIDRMFDEALVNPEAAAALLRENNPVNRAYLTKKSKLWGVDHADQFVSAVNDDEERDPVKDALKRARR